MTVLRQYLKELEPSGLVNTATFGRLDNFDAELSGNTQIGKFRDAVAHMFSDFSSMKDKNIRKQIAGGITGPAGTCGVDFFGYINLLKDCDMDVQFTLFMPDVAKSQQKGFKVDHFEYKKMPGNALHRKGIDRRSFRLGYADCSRHDACA